MKTCIIFLITFYLLCSSINAQQFHSDNGDGTFTNPVIASDFPDPDVIHVGDYYYMITTTMYIFPGASILRSHDLVNWEYCSNAIPRFDYSPCYNLDKCNRYGHGQWATSLKFHNGIFYLLFITLDEGGFICTSDNAKGPWQITRLPKGFYDPGLFFDDNGKVYVAHGYNNLFITELDHNFAPAGKDSLVFTGDIRKGLEGTHMYKINGYYYLYCTYGGKDGIQVALRSKQIYGPYEEKIVLRDTTKSVTYGVHQGALIETSSGEWWSMLFVDSGPFGRFPSLQPVTWINDWPMIGLNGQGVITYKKPAMGKSYPIKDLPTSDEFSNNHLGLQWGWNHNPDTTSWSLTQNPGFLRLTAGKVVSSLPEAPNMLTQRIFTHRNQAIPTIGTIKICVDNMKDGDIAGLAIFQDPYAYIAIKQDNGIRRLIMVNDGNIISSVLLTCDSVYLRAITSNKAKKVTFAYSLNNYKFIPIGNELIMQFSLRLFTGNKFGLFIFATQQTGGYVDFDWFRMM